KIPFSFGPDMFTSTIRKAAVVLMSLPDEEMRAVAGKLGRRQVERVATEMARIGVLSRQEQAATIRGLVESSAETKPFGFLATLDLEQVCEAIQDEHSQTIAVIASHLPRTRANAVL